MKPVRPVFWIAPPLLLAAAVAAGALFLASRDDHPPIADQPSPPATLERAANAFDQGRYEEALSLALSVLETQSGDARAHSIAGRCLALPGLGDPVKAIQHLNRAVRLGTKDKETRILLAELTIRQIRLTGRGRVRDIRDALGVEVGSFGIDRVLLLARCDLAFGDTAKAIRRLREASWRPGGLPEAGRFLLAKAQWRRGEVTHGRNRLLELMETAKDPVLLLRASEFTFQAGSPETGERILARTVERFPDHPLVVLVQARHIANALPVEEIERRLRAAVAANPESNDAKIELAELLLTSADPDGHEELRIEEARELIRDLGREARVAEALVRARGRWPLPHHSKTGDAPSRDRALRDLEELSAERPEDLRLHVYLANLHRLQHDVARELSELDLALRARPRDSALLVRRADALLRAGRPDAAAEDLRAAVTHGKESPEIHRLIARTHLDRVVPDPAAALDSLGRAADLSGGSDRPAAAVDRVRAMRLAGEVDAATTLAASLAKDLPGPDLKVDLAAELGRLGEVDAADELIDQVLKGDTEMTRARLTRAALRKDPVEARKVLNGDPENLVAMRLLFTWEPSRELVAAAEKINETDPSTLHMRGRWAYGEKRMVEAVRDLRTALAAEPRDRGTAKWLWLALAEADDPALLSETIAILGAGSEAAMADPRLPVDAALLVLRAERAKARGDAETWLDACRRLRDLRPADPEAGVRLAEALLAAGRTKDAEAALPADAPALTLRARLLETKGETEEARIAYEQILEGSPAHPQAMDGLARLGKLSPSKFRTLVARQMRRDGVSMAHEAEAALRLVEIEVLEKEHAQALSHVRMWAARRLTPPATTGLILFQGGLAAEDLGRPVEAEELYRSSLRLLPDHIPALNNLALLLCGDSESALDGLRFAKRAAALAPGLAEVHDTLGTACETTGDRPGAIAAFRRAAELFEKRGKAGSKELEKTRARLANLIGAVGEEKK